MRWATYSGMQRASGRSGWAKILSSPTADGGKAYIVRATNGSAILNVKVPEGASTGEISMALTLKTYEASHQENANWNFIGNLYNVGYNIAGFAAMGITSPITVWNGTGYSIYTPGIDEYILQPFEPFFIQVSDSGAVSELMFSPEYFEDGNGSDPTGGNEGSYTYTFISKSWAAEEGNWLSGMDGYGYTAGQGVQCTTNTSGANAECPISYSNISSVVVKYCSTSAKYNAGSVSIDIAGNTITQDVISNGDTELYELTFDYADSMPSGTPSITVQCSENSIYIYSVTIVTK